MDAKRLQDEEDRRQAAVEERARLDILFAVGYQPPTGSKCQGSWPTCVRRVVRERFCEEHLRQETVRLHVEIARSQATIAAARARIELLNPPTHVAKEPDPPPELVRPTAWDRLLDD